MWQPAAASLILEDGTQWSGHSFGAVRSTAGEVVFNTSMMGYPEALTDPSYRGQILVLTYPLIGNYGVPGPECDAMGFPRWFESEAIQVAGLVVADYSDEHSHWNGRRSLGEWLAAEGIPALTGVDTRALTRRIREQGVLQGKLDVEGAEPALGFVDPNRRNLVAEVSCREVKTYGTGRYRIVLVDCGCKLNIIRCLVRRDATVIRVPWDYDFTRLGYDGVMLSNGPGDPALCTATVGHIRKAISLGKPIFGICLGHQLLSRAAGATTYKLKYGHRSHNQPVLEEGSDRAFITSQNHGFAVDTSTLGEGWEPSFTNLNDATSEGIRHRSLPFFSVQFHPEATSGPVDTEYLFDRFLDLIKRYHG